MSEVWVLSKVDAEREDDEYHPVAAFSSEEQCVRLLSSLELVCNTPARSYVDHPLPAKYATEKFVRVVREKDDSLSFFDEYQTQLHESGTLFLIARVWLTADGPFYHKVFPDPYRKKREETSAILAAAGLPDVEVSGRELWHASGSVPLMTGAVQ